jgi:hypothetical protein
MCFVAVIPLLPGMGKMAQRSREGGNKEAGQEEEEEMVDEMEEEEGRSLIMSFTVDMEGMERIETIRANRVWRGMLYSKRLFKAPWGEVVREGSPCFPGGKLEVPVSASTHTWMWEWEA